MMHEQLEMARVVLDNIIALHNFNLNDEEVLEASMLMDELIVDFMTNQ